MKEPGFIKVEGAKMIAQVEALAREIWREHYPPIIGEAQVEYMLGKIQSSRAIEAQIRQGHLYHLILDHSGVPVGYLGVRIDKDALFLSKVYVRASERGKGYGGNALRFVEAIAREKGCARIWLTVHKRNAGSIGVYERNGYRRVEAIVQDIGQDFVMDDYRMEKRLI